MGKLFLSNGEVFEGLFKKDSINGQGKFTNLQGEVIEGVWENNVLTEILNN